MSVASARPSATTDGVPAFSDALRNQGFAFVAGAAMRAVVESRGGRDWDGFAASWNDLEPDRFMADGGTYRKRRFACFGLEGDAIRRKPAQPHYQTKENNPLNGGVARVFAPVTDAIAAHPTTVALLRTCAQTFAAVRPARRWHVEMHQFRIEAQAGSGGLPTPEGMHRDGVDFVLTLMVGRTNVEGGSSTILDEDRRVQAEATLREPLESYLIDDRRMFHAVSPVHPVEPDRPAYRDVLVVTFRDEEG